MIVINSLTPLHIAEKKESACVNSYVALRF